MNNQQQAVRAEYIKRIEIEALWGRKHIVWDLRRDVNILSGVNGIGKSTILNRTAAALNRLANGVAEEAGAEDVKLSLIHI